MNSLKRARVSSPERNGGAAARKDLRGDAAAGAPAPPAATGAQMRAGMMSVLLPLSEDVISPIFALLSVEERLRYREVSPAWRDALQLPIVWRDVDLLCATDWSVRRGVRVLGLASRFAATGMTSLRLALAFTQRMAFGPRAHAEYDALTGAVRANGAALRALDLRSNELTTDRLSHLLELCPALESFHVSHYTHVLSTAADAQQLVALLSRAGLAVRSLTLNNALNVRQERLAVYPVEGLEAALERHVSLRKLCVECPPMDDDYNAAMMGLVRAAARAGAVDFKLSQLDQRLAHVFTLDAAALLREFPVQHLQMNFDGGRHPFAGNLFAAQFADALRSSATLQTLKLDSVSFDRHETELLVALQGHPTLHTLSLSCCSVVEQANVHVALAGLLAAQSALRHLSLFWLDMAQEHLCAALKGLTSADARLESLDLTEMDAITPTFAARVVGSTVVRCASMRHVELCAQEPENGEHARFANKLRRLETAINLLLQANDDDDDDDDEEEEEEEEEDSSDDNDDN
jgi:hypothetical protein